MGGEKRKVPTLPPPHLTGAEDAADWDVGRGDSTRREGQEEGEGGEKPAHLL